MTPRPQSRLRRAARRVWHALVGQVWTPPAAVLAVYPELADARWRTGGLPLRVGGWCLGQRTVAGITLWRTVFLADPARAPAALLLHELAHVHQFARVRGFAVRYCWESLRHGYARNRYETQADAFARALTARGHRSAAPLRPPAAGPLR